MAVVVAGLLPLVAAATGGVGSAIAAAGQPSTTISLLSQTPWITGANRLALSFAVSSPMPTVGLDLSINLYPRLYALSSFEQTMHGQPVGNVLEAPATIPLTDYPSFRAAKSGGTSGIVSLDLDVTPYSIPARVHPVDDPAITLDCYAGQATSGPPPQLGAQCAGVYPLQVSVIDSQFTVLTSFITFLVYAPSGSGSTPLRVAWIVPLGSELPFDAKGAPEIARQDVAMIGTLANALGANPGLDLSLQVYGAAAAALAASHDKGQQDALAALRLLALSPARYEFTRTPYVPVDPNSFSSSGLQSDMAAQLSLSGSVLSRDVGASIARGPYVANGALDSGALSMLAGDGVSHMVLPGADVSGVSDPADATVTQPFDIRGLSSGTSALEGSSVDPSLQAEFEDAGATPALAAQQLLANLAFLYFGDPYDPDPRGVVLMQPPNWTPSGRFVNALAAGLGASPVLQPVTISQFMGGVPIGGNGQPRTRGVVIPPAAPSFATAGNGQPTLPAGAIAAARGEIAAYGSYVSGQKATLESLELAVLSSESSDFTEPERQLLLGLPAAALGDYGRDISLPQGRILTLTSNSPATVPISIISRSTYPLHVKLVLSNPELGLRLPRSVYGPFTVTKGTTVENVQVGTRTSGDFILKIQVQTPQGGDTVAEGDLTVRSTAISGLAFGLSAGALLLLLVWWVRSSRARRRARLAEEAGAAGDVAPDEVDEAAEVDAELDGDAELPAGLDSLPPVDATSPAPADA